MGKPWKELEKRTAAALGGVRINRADDYGVSDVDVVVPGFDFLRIDCKYRKSHAHHSLIEEIRRKYCTAEGQYPVLVTKHHHSHREYVTVDLVLFAALLKLLGENENENENPPETKEGPEDPEQREELDQTHSKGQPG